MDTNTTPPEKKRDRSVSAIRREIASFRCPACGTPMRLEEHRSLLCEHRHTYDIARNGYINFLSRPPRHPYAKELFQSRREVWQRGYFKPFLRDLCEILALLPVAGQSANVLDAGCGEGSLLAGLFRDARLPDGSSLWGVDISRDAIRMAASQKTEALWMVADLAHLPLADGSMDIILNVLSPASYGEFSRILRPGGILVKVFPGPLHFQEVRRLVDEGSRVGTESEGPGALHLFEEKVDVLYGRRSLSTTAVPEEDVDHILGMSPLLFAGAPPPGARVTEITVDLEIRVGEIREGS